MIKTIQIRYCDVCKKEVEDLPGTLTLKYSDRDYAGNGFPAGIKYEDICIDCCRKLDNLLSRGKLDERLRDIGKQEK